MVKRLNVLSALALCAMGAAFGSTAWAAKTCDVAIEGNDQMKFNLEQIAVAADCTEVAVTLKHAGKLQAAAMGHNWVLTKTADFQAVANAGMAAGLAGDYLQKDDKRIIAHTKVVGGGESATVKFATSALTKGGDYTFFCSFPGHYVLMKGKLTFG